MKARLILLSCIGIAILPAALDLFARQMNENVAIERVNVYLSATNKKGQFVTDLKPAELVIKENGVVQSITNFASLANEPADQFGEQGVPITAAFLIDISNSMATKIQGQAKIDIVKNASFRLMDELRQQDKMMLIAFSENPKEVTPLSNDKKKMQEGLLFESVEGGNTALLDSIYFAMKKLKGEWGRKIIVICSDGEDTASKIHFDEVQSNLIAADITVLAFGTLNLSSNSLRGRYILQKLADSTGGYAFFPTNLSSLDEVMDKLKKGMRSQYSLGYRPSNSKKDGSWRKIEITCLRTGLKLRYRNGYNAN